MDNIIYVLIGLGLVLFLTFTFLVDNVVDKLGDWTFRKLGLQTGKGPLVATAESQGDKILLLLENQGQDKIKLLAVEGRDPKQNRQFLVPYLKQEEFAAGSADGSLQKQFAKMTIAPRETHQVILDAKELSATDCQTLAVLDHAGKAWPVAGFAPFANI